MSRDINPFGLRMQPDLRSAIESAAAEAGRSLNSEITGRLQRSLNLDASVPLQAKRDLALKELRAAIAEVLRLWELDSRDAAEQAMLEDAIDDLRTWDRQLGKMEELQEAMTILQRAAEAKRGS